MVDEPIINQILEDYSKFTKEEYEIVNTYEVKQEAKYSLKRAERIGNTDPKYLVRRKYIDKYGDIALKHKEMIINVALEEFNGHKEILLQCLSIMQSLVQNPNVLDTLANILSSTWYGGQDFKEYLASIINNHEQKLNEIHTELYNLRNCPIMFYLPELYGLTHDEIKKLPAYDQPDSRLVSNYRVMTDENYPLLP